METKPQPTFSWEESFAQDIYDSFFEAVKWSLLSRPLVPPTLVTKFRLGEFTSLEKMGIPLHELLHGEQEYRFHQMLKPDTKYTGEVFLKNDHAKKGKRGSMRFLVFQTDLKNEEGIVCVECISTLVHMKPATPSEQNKDE